MNKVNFMPRKYYERDEDWLITVLHAVVQVRRVKGFRGNDAQNVMEQENWDASKGNNWQFLFQLVSLFTVRFARAWERSLIGLKPVPRFFPHSNLSQTTVVSAQNKSQRVSMKYPLNWFPHLVHLYILTMNRPKFHSFVILGVCALQFGHFGITLHLLKSDKITIYHFHGPSPANLMCYLLCARSKASISSLKRA